MSRPHTHPSLHCYKRHGCRCKGCRAENTLSAARWRHQTKLPKREPKRQNPPLPDSELHRLRRLVGLE